MAELVSVIIPTWNEEAMVGECLLSLGVQEGPWEAIVADGGSTDRTRDLASRHARVVLGARSRGDQLNAGAAASTGEILIFLHADCRLGPGALREARRVLGRSRVKAGCYPQKIAKRSPLYRLVEWGAAARAKCLGIVYGDSALFLRREVFERCGGFPSVPLFEDFGISQRLRTMPGRVALASSWVEVSPRRWEERGFFRSTFLNWRLQASYLAGASPEALARRYERVVR